MQPFYFRFLINLIIKEAIAVPKPYYEIISFEIIVIIKEFWLKLKNNRNTIYADFAYVETLGHTGICREKVA